jgi:soluble P-type ATPase
MILIQVPGFADLCLEHLVIDFNGTLAEDGVLLSGVRPLLAILAEELQIHVITADTFGRAAAELAGIRLRLTIIPSVGQAEAKLQYVQAINANRVVAIGNGRNDHLMLAAVALGIAVVQQEGVAAAALSAADIIVTSIITALELLRSRQRLIATLRS